MNFRFAITFFSFFNLLIASIILYQREYHYQAMIVLLNSLAILVMMFIQRKQDLVALKNENDYLKNALAWETYKSLSEQERVEVLKNMIISPKIKG
jgi:hypothetical protein